MENVCNTSQGLMQLRAIKLNQSISCDYKNTWKSVGSYFLGNKPQIMRS